MNKIYKIISLNIVIITLFTLPSFSFEDEEKYIVLNSKQAVKELDQKIQKEETPKPTHIAITDPQFIRTSDYMSGLGITLNEWGVTHFKARNIGLASDDIETMRDFFRRAKSIKHFDLTDNKIGANGVYVLWDAIINPSRNFIELDLRGNTLIKARTIEDINYNIYETYIDSNRIIDTKIYLDNITIPYNVNVFQKIPLWLRVANNWVDGISRNEEENTPDAPAHNMPDFLKGPSHTIITGLRDLTLKTEECFNGISSLFSENRQAQ